MARIYAQLYRAPMPPLSQSAPAGDGLTHCRLPPDHLAAIAASDKREAPQQQEMAAFLIRTSLVPRFVHVAPEKQTRSSRGL